MRIKDTAIIISKKPLEENSFIIHCLTKEHGIFAGVARNINSKNSHIYQIGNLVDFFWNARLEEHIGTAKCELLSSSHHFMNNKVKLYALSSIVAMILASFKERIPHPILFEHIQYYIKNGDKPFKIMDYIFLEGKILEEAGYGLDFRCCAATGSTENLAYVSPKSAKAVSEEAAGPYKSQLLKLPPSALTGLDPESEEELKELFDLTGYFFLRYILKDGQHPEERKRFVSSILGCGLDDPSRIT